MKHSIRKATINTAYDNFTHNLKAIRFALDDMTNKSRKLGRFDKNFKTLSVRLSALSGDVSSVIRVVNKSHLSELNLISGDKK